jgi:hypothetical protein
MQGSDLSNRKYQSFVFLYSARDASKSLLDHAKIEAHLKIGLSRIWTIRTTYHGMNCMAMVSTTKTYTLGQMSALMNAEKYNAIDPGGLQIVERLVILCKAHAHEYATCAQMVRSAVFNRQHYPGILLGDWTLSDDLHSTRNHKTVAANSLLELTHTARAVDAAGALLDLMDGAYSGSAGMAD